MRGQIEAEMIGEGRDKSTRGRAMRIGLVLASAAMLFALGASAAEEKKKG